MSLAKEDSAAEIKGRMVSLTVVEVFKADLEQLDRVLQEKVALAPRFFRGAPVMIDLEHLDQEVDGAWLEKVWGLLLANSFVPVGITGVTESFSYIARTKNIAVWPVVDISRHTAKEKAAPARISESRPEPAPEVEPEAGQEPISASICPQEHEQTKQRTDRPDMPAETLVIHQPVRSGQKVYARGGDLLVLASVSTGAEILADGHIHVYGSLRGRAFAGARGNKQARVFCTDLQADLVAIAGVYIINDDLADEIQHSAVQIFLQEDQLKIEPLGSWK